MAESERDAGGRFAPGNPGGPGRPRRAVEREYLAALSDAVTLDDWRDICAVTVARAKAGDARARDWVARYVLGADPLTLADLAAREALDVDAEAEISALAEAERAAGTGGLEFLMGDPPTVIGRAIEARERAQRQALREAAEAEKRRRAAERRARKSAEAAAAGGELASGPAEAAE